MAPGYRLASDMAPGGGTSRAFDGQLPVGGICLALSQLRWTVAACRNPDGGPIEIVWADGQVTVLDTSPTNGITARSAAANGAPADAQRAPAGTSIGHWEREELTSVNPFARVAGARLTGVALDHGLAPVPERLTLRFNSATVEVRVFRGELQIGLGQHHR
ncbi:hypothetical protein GCM10023350_23250 [Nocardioides endophyticus]|uniref:Uncharacterized protein n=1 Tax=Nocardioides endophyticus TaxID=1353775 RepID=A0ABP8YUQ6_9ACTN